MPVTEPKGTSWAGAVVTVASLGATCFAIHGGQVWWGVWFAFVTAVGLGAMVKVAK